MLSQAALRFPLPWLTVLGLFIFLGVFVGVLLWVNRKGSDQIYGEMARAPLNGGSEL